MFWVLLIAGLIAGPIAIMALWGRTLPKEHRARCAATVPAPAAATWRTITDLEATADWRPDVDRIEVTGEDAWTEHGKHGAIPMVVETRDEPTRLVVRIADESLPFGGSWTYQLDDRGDATRVTITEDGEIDNPLFRFLSRYLFSRHATATTYLTALARKHGGDAEVEIIE